MAAPRTPPGLGPRGRRLWKALTAHGPAVAEQEVALEACRTADRLEKYDALLSGDVVTWARLVVDLDSDTTYELRVTNVVNQANQGATLMKQLIAAVRVPDAATGAKPQQRGTPRGAYRVRGSAPADRSSSKPRSLTVVDDVG